MIWVSASATALPEIRQALSMKVGSIFLITVSPCVFAFLRMF
jgi:hypothetical protein